MIGIVLLWAGDFPIPSFTDSEDFGCGEVIGEGVAQAERTRDAKNSAECPGKISGLSEKCRCLFHATG